MDKNYVTVIIPTYNEEEYVEKCLESLLQQSYPQNCIEILVIDGGSTDKTRQLVLNYSNKCKNIRMINNPKKVQVTALNIGIVHALGEIIVMLGAHAIYDKEYVSECVYLLKNKDASNVGGVQKAIAIDYVGKSIALAMSHPFGVGNAYFRYLDKEIYVDSVFGGALWKKTLIDLGGFNESYSINEDYELNYRIRKSGGKILLSPRIKCKYFARNSLIKLFKQYFLYGQWKVKTLKEHPDSVMYRQIIPLLFVVTFMLSLVTFAFNWKIGIFIPLLYIVTNVLVSSVICIKSSFIYFPIIVAAFASMHFAYGIGFIFGLKVYGIPKINVSQIVKSSLSKL